MNVSIQIKNTTKEKLAKLGDLSSTFDSVIIDLMNHAKSCDKFWEDRHP